ncbi:MAG: DUF2834 domain-containing protein [Aurantimicrobium sp.]|uniref:DUF2834 domain-containing protein n=1 Tax=Aurantimicrobium sp. TaxID=1930784 RepID=UPI002FC88564
MHKKLFWVYLVLSIAGLITAWIFNGIAVMNQEDYLGAWFGSAVDWVLSADLTIVAIAVVVFMITESRRIGMKRVWLYILLSGVTAMAFTFPLFMAMRERRLGELSSTALALKN